MEGGFIDYLFTFFYDKGMPALATTIKEGSKFRIADDIVDSMKMALKPALYNELIENSFYYAPPYLPVYGFMKRFKKWPMLCLTVMEWREEKIKDEFTKYADNLSATHKAETIINHVNKLIASLKWT
jgi:hypothetical protein